MKLIKPMMDSDEWWTITHVWTLFRPQHCEYARHNIFLPSLFSITTGSTLSINIVRCVCHGVKARGPGQTAIAHSCANATKALLVASPLSIGSSGLRSCSTWKNDTKPDKCGQPAHYLKNSATFGHPSTQLEGQCTDDSSTSSTILAQTANRGSLTCSDIKSVTWHHKSRTWHPRFFYIGIV